VQSVSTGLPLKVEGLTSELNSFHQKVYGSGQMMTFSYFLQYVLMRWQLQI